MLLASLSSIVLGILGIGGILLLIVLWCMCAPKGVLQWVFFGDYWMEVLYVLLKGIGLCIEAIFKGGSD